MTDPATQEELRQLRLQLQEAEDWANGVFLALQQVLPALLRGHPEVKKVQALLAGRDQRFEELRRHPERAEPDERPTLHEPGKMLYRQLALLGVWPDMDPREEAQRVLRTHGWRPTDPPARGR